MEQTDISSDIAIQRRRVNIVVIRYRNNIVHENFSRRSSQHRYKGSH